jgi:hypothetical protein
MKAKSVDEDDEPLHVGFLRNENERVNFGGNYDYMSRAYFISQDYENRGERIKPTCKEMLDAYVPPLFLEKAKLADIPIPPYYISNGYFEPPAIIDPVNPFTLKGRVVLKPSRVKNITKSLTRNFTYAICCQEITEKSRVVYFRSVLGWSTQIKYRNISKIVWEVFNIPLAKIRVIQLESGEMLLSDISPLFLEDLKKREKQYLEDRVIWGN